MIHIRQRNSNAEVYTVVITDGFEGLINEHPSIVHQPDLFEIVDEPIPNNAQYLDYTESEE